MSTPKESQRRYLREPARRAFAAEVREVRLTFKDGGEDEKSPVYVMLPPSGIRCNRLFFCGQVTRKELKGEDNTFYSVRVQDPTGIFFVSAGIYQPEAKQQISRIEESAWVAVVGKAQVRNTPPMAQPSYQSGQNLSLRLMRTPTGNGWTKQRARRLIALMPSTRRKTAKRHTNFMQTTRKPTARWHSMHSSG